MPRMGLMALKTRDENVPFGSLVHSDAVIYVGRGDDSHVKYYIIAAVIISLFISLLSSFLNLRSRLSHGLPARAHQRFLFRRTVRAHAQKEGSAPQQDGPQGAYNMTGVAPMPVNDPAGYPAYSGHTNGGEKLDSVQESTKRVAEADALPEYEAPLGPPPPAVTR